MELFVDYLACRSCSLAANVLVCSEDHLSQQNLKFRKSLINFLNGLSVEERSCEGGVLLQAAIKETFQYTSNN
jgi:hypothetical protein